MKFSVKHLFSKWSHSLKKFLIKNFIFLYTELTARAKALCTSNWTIKTRHKKVLIAYLLSNKYLHLQILALVHLEQWNPHKKSPKILSKTTPTITEEDKPKCVLCNISNIFMTNSRVTRVLNQLSSGKINHS